MPLTLEEIRLRILELALEHANSPDKLAAARAFEAYVLGRKPLERLSWNERPDEQPSAT